MIHILRRLGFYVIAAWASFTLAFLLPRLMPGDPVAAMMARSRGNLSPEAATALREAFGVTDAPLYSQYFSYLGQVFTGDLGVSVTYFPASVTSVISSGMVWTLFLAGIAMVISFVLGTLLGILTAWRRGGRLDSVAPPAFVFLGAFPYFWLGVVPAQARVPHQHRTGLHLGLHLERGGPCRAAGGDARCRDA